MITMQPNLTRRGFLKVLAGVGAGLTLAYITGDEYAAAADAADAGFDDSLIYSEIQQPHSQRKIPMVPMMREEALEGFRTWKKQINKVPY